MHSKVMFWSEFFDTLVYGSKFTRPSAIDLSSGWRYIKKHNTEHIYLYHDIHNNTH